jgi:exosome complex component RRP41
LRLLEVELGINNEADGSVRYKQGNTEVVALVYGPKQAKHHFRTIHDRARVEVEFAVSNFATNERKNPGRQDRSSRENGLILKETLEACMLTDLFPRSEILIFVQVLSDDGGVLSAAINAASCALATAGVPMKDFITACSAGFVDNLPILDLNFGERTMGTPVLTYSSYSNSRKVACMRLTARMDAAHLESVMQAAQAGCTQIAVILKGQIQEFSERRLHTRSGLLMGQ